MTRTIPTRAAGTVAPRRAAIAVFAGLAAVTTLAGCAADAVEAEPATSDPTTETTETAPPAETAAPAEADSVFTDGTYSADGSYESPNGSESISVTVTIADDVVTAVEVTPHATGGNSAQFQGQFASGISAEVVGVALDDVSVSRVAGSSLTSGGFNAAIDAIQSQAQS